MTKNNGEPPLDDGGHGPQVGSGVPQEDGSNPPKGVRRESRLRDQQCSAASTLPQQTIRHRLRVQPPEGICRRRKSRRLLLPTRELP